MDCEEIREHFVEIIYDEDGTAPANAEAREHLRTCIACRRELEELRHTRKYLQLWKDEAPLRPVIIARQGAVAPRRFHWKYLRYAAIAAMIVVCFLALANTQITLNSEGFRFSTGLFAEHRSAQDYYTKSEVLDIMKRALDDSELRMNETSFLMMQRMWDAVEQDRWNDLRLVRGHAVLPQNRN
jgi:predicted anti-sigma-YlaC factor YlaD